MTVDDGTSSSRTHGEPGSSAPPELLAAAMEVADQPMLITDAQLAPPGPRIVFVNEAFTRMTGYPADRIVGSTPRILQGPDTDPAVTRRLRQRLDRGEGFSGRTVNYRRDGRSFHVEWRVTPLRDRTGVITHFVAVQHDVTALEQFVNALSAEADRDALTGLPNRSAVRVALEREIQRAQRYELGLAIVLFDIDGFTAINEAHGQDTGDRLLSGLAERIRERLRANDTLGRWGGDEFLVVLPHATAEAAAAVAHAVLDYARTPDAPGEVAATASVAAVEWAPGTRADGFLADAEACLRRARERGGDRVEPTG